MRTIRDISEDEMIAVYLQTEFHSSRFQQEIAAHVQRAGIDPYMLQAPDWQNAQENTLRRRLLGAYRGYGRNQGYFIGFPTNMRWERATLTRQELDQVRYIAYDYWVELSGGTRMAVDGARNANAGMVVFGVQSSGLVYMANELQRGAQFPPLILVAKDADAIRRVMKGERVVDPEFALVALSEGNNPLTIREREVLTVSLTGASLVDIAAHLCLSEGTVRNHLSIAMQKLGARNRMEAARRAEQKGWL